MNLLWCSTIVTIYDLAGLCLIAVFPLRCAGYLFQKVGKLAASAVGGGFFLLQVKCDFLCSASIYFVFENP